MYAVAFAALHHCHWGGECGCKVSGFGVKKQIFLELFELGLPIALFLN